MKIKTRGNQAFNVPNDDEGRNFLKLLRKFRNRRWHYRALGRGSRKEHGCQLSIAQEHSEWMAVYLEQREKKPQTSFAVFNNVPLSHFAEQPVSDSQFQITINPSPMAVNPGPHHSICGCDPAAGFLCIAHQPAGIFTGNVAEWSARIPVGGTVAVNNDGRVYNPAVHGLAGPGDSLGTAVSDTEGLVGEGEATVRFQLDPPPVVGWDAAPAGVKPLADNEVELTEAEQALLDEILAKLHNEYAVTEWEEEKQDTFYSLYEKLVD